MISPTQKRWFWSGLLFWFTALFMALMLPGSLVLSAAHAQELPAPSSSDNSNPSAPSIYAPVRINSRKLFDVMGNNGLTAAERADKIHRRLVNLILRSEPVPPFSDRDVKDVENVTTIALDGETLMSVTDADAQDALTTRKDLAQLWGQKIWAAVADARSTRENPFTGAGILIRNSFSDLFISTLRWLPRLAGGVVLTVLFWLLAALNRRIARAIISRTKFDSNLRQLFRSLAYYGTWTIGLLAILSTLGLDSSSIATTLGISGFVLGFAFKDILSHFFAGFMLLMGRQFHVGDQIVVKEFEGTVERIELRALYLRTYDNRLVIIPNGDVFTSIVTSNTASAHRRREFVIGIGYEADIDHAHNVAIETVKHVPGVSAEPPPDVLLDELANSTVNLRIRFHTNSQRADYLKVGSECMRRVKEAFDREHISMPTDITTIVIENIDFMAESIGKAVHASLYPTENLPSTQSFPPSKTVTAPPGNEHG